MRYKHKKAYEGGISTPQAPGVQRQNMEAVNDGAAVAQSNTWKEAMMAQFSVAVTNASTLSRLAKGQ